jgi:hypothetical protein
LAGISQRSVGSHLICKRVNFDVTLLDENIVSLKSHLLLCLLLNCIVTKPAARWFFYF